MESVGHDTRLRQFSGEPVQRRDAGAAAVEGRVEAPDLYRIGQEAGGKFDDFKISRLMERSERDEPAQRL